MNSPCSTTPGIAFSNRARCGASLMRSRWASTIQWPPSVTKTWPSLFFRTTICPETPLSANARPMARRVAARPNGMTSTGNGKRPRTSTHLESSAITIMRSDAAATIFSRSNAPPPPLMTLRAGLISSAPSTVRSSRSISSSVVRGMPQRTASARVASDVGTPMTSSPARTRSPRSSTKCFAVEPVPSPSFMPSRTNSRARAAACRFNSSISTCNRCLRTSCRSRHRRHRAACLASFSGQEQRHGRTQPQLVGFADDTLASHRRFAHCGQDGGKPLLHFGTHFRMREYVEFVLADRGEDSRRNLRRVEPGLQQFGDLGDQRARRACGVERRRRTIALRPIAPTLADAGANVAGTEHAHADAKRLDLHRQPLRHRDHRELARRVRAKPQPALHSGHGRGVDDVAAFTVGPDVRQEGTDTVKDTHKVDVEHASPIVDRYVVDAATGGDAGIVADHMDISKGVVRCLGGALDAADVGNVTTNAAHIRPNIVQAFDSGRQRVRLDIGEHHFHARLRKSPAEGEPDAAGPARHERCLAGKFSHDCPLFL